MSVKLKFVLILILSVFAAAGAGVYMVQHPVAVPMADNLNFQLPELSAVQNTQEIVGNTTQNQYRSIPLEGVTSPLQGSDPQKLAVNFMDDFRPAKGDRQITVNYGQPNQAFVTVIQTQSEGDSTTVMRYYLQMNSLGRSLLSNSPPIWQIVWVGYQVPCSTTRRTPTQKSKVKHQKPQSPNRTNQLKLEQDNCQVSQK